jgi:hypothetical protein
MPRPFFAARFWLCLASVALSVFAGCDPIRQQPPQVGGIKQVPGSAGTAASGSTASPGSINANPPKEIITVRDGQVTYGPPKMTEEVERQLYSSLAYRRNLARSIEAQIPGGNRGGQQCWEEYHLLAKGWMARYGITEADINAILTKGDQQGWPIGAN